MRVERYGQRRVETRPLPAAYKTNAPSAESMGAGFAGQVGDIGINALSGMWERERRAADQLALLNADNELSAWESRRLYDPQAGALNVRGRDSFGLPEQVLGDLNKVSDEIRQRLGTPAQKLAFEQAVAQRKQSLDLRLRRHVWEQINEVDAAETTAFLENRVSSAIANAGDVQHVSDELGKGLAAIADRADRMGLGAEEKAKQELAFKTSVHVGVIDAYLSSGQERAAQVYFEEVQQQIDGKSVARIKTALEEGQLRGEAQKQADAIIKAGGTEAEQREKARAIEEPKLRDEVMTRIEHEAAVNERARRDAHEAAYKSLIDTIDAGRATPSSLQRSPAWRDLSVGERSSALNYLEAKARGVPVQTDWVVWSSLMKKAGDDPAAFVAENLLKYRSKLDDVEFKQLTSLQLSLRGGDRGKAEADLATFNTNSQLLEGALAQYGMNANTDANAAAVGQLRRMLDSRVAAQSALTGKKPSNLDIQSMIDDILSQSVEVPGSWWALVSPNQYDLATRRKRLVDVKVGDISAADRTAIEKALRSAGRPVSDVTVLDLYIETKARVGK